MKYIVYTLAALMGLHLRLIVSSFNGWDYSVNGVDLVVAVACVTAVWSFKGAFLHPKDKPTKKRRK